MMPPTLPLAGCLLLATVLAGCTAPPRRPPAITYDDAIPAVPMAEPPRPVELVEVPTPLPLPGQLKPAPVTAEPPDPASGVALANAAARIEPVRDGYINAMQVYPYSEGALYQLYAAPGQVTDITLQEGERLVDSSPVAAGDTVRWIIGDTESGSGAAKRIHVLVKPTRPGLVTNLVINTDRRTYHLELRSTEETYMASVSWLYPQDQFIALRRRNEVAEGAEPIASGIDVTALSFRYAIDGDDPPWRPLRAYDDGRQVFIEFPAGIAQGEMPPLLVIGPEGQGELVNYRVRGRHMIIDRLFAAAELRLGAEPQQVVRIARSDGKRPS